jgi:hypothetical protein
MQKRHEDQLASRLDELFITGVTSISWAELYYWYNVDKIRKAPYRDILDKWERILEERGVDDAAEVQTVHLDDRVSFYYANGASISLNELAK